MAITYYQLLKVYSKLLDPKFVENATCSIPQIDLEKFVDFLTKELEHYICDFPYVWNIISTFEAQFCKNETQPTNSPLDKFFKKHADLLNNSKYDAKWKKNWDELFSNFNATPAAPPKKGLGALTLKQVNSADNRRGTRNIPYCFLGRLFNFQAQSLPHLSPILEVVLTSPYLSNHQLDSFWYDKEEEMHYRIDLFGGNHMKAACTSIEDLLAGRTNHNYGRLIAMPVSELSAKSKFSELMMQLFSNKESFFYFQRAFLAAPKLQKKGEEDGTQKGVLEGKFHIQIFKNYEPNAIHPFQLKDGIALRPHDGCGFIKEKLAKAMGIALEASDRFSNNSDMPKHFLPAQALQHYIIDHKNPLHQKVLQEIQLKLMTNIPSQPNDIEKFYGLTTGGIKGRNLLALPSSDGKIHYCSSRKECSSILIGRAPYDQANLYAVEKYQLPGDIDAHTANFLQSDGQVIQYSLVVQQQDPCLWFAKGLLVVVPDHLWPDAYNNSDIVISSADVKTHTGWVSHQAKEAFHAKSDRRLEVSGSLVAVDLFPLYKSIALPIDAQTYLSGDFDGDQVLVIDDYEKLYQFIHNHNQQNNALCNRTLKPAKNVTSAFDQNNEYVYSRRQEISATKQKVLETYSTLQSLFLALPLDKRKAVSENVRKAVQGKVDVDKKLDSALWLINFLSSGIKAGTDAYKSGMDITFFVMIAPLVESILAKTKVKVPYSKSYLSKCICNGTLNKEQIKKALEENPTPIAWVMKCSIEYLL